MNFILILATAHCYSIYMDSMINGFIEVTIVAKLVQHTIVFEFSGGGRHRSAIGIEFGLT